MGRASNLHSVPLNLADACSVATLCNYAMSFRSATLGFSRRCFLHKNSASGVHRRWWLARRRVCWRHASALRVALRKKRAALTLTCRTSSVICILYRNKKSNKNLQIFLLKIFLIEKLIFLIEKNKMKKIILQYNTKILLISSYIYVISCMLVVFFSSHIKSYYSSLCSIMLCKISISLMMLINLLYILTSFINVT